MANTLLSPSIIAKEMLFQLENNTVMGNLVHREYVKEFHKIGDTVTIRKPVKFLATDGVTMVLQDVEELSTSIVINQRKHVAWPFSSKELTLNIEDYSERYLKPAAITLNNTVDAALCALHMDIYLARGTAGTTPNTFAVMGDVAARMDNMAVPYDSRVLVMNPDANWAIADGLKGLFMQKRVEDIIAKGYLGSVANFDLYCDQNIKRHVKGVATGTPLSNGATQTGASIATDGWTNSTTGILLLGDIITFAGVNAVNPISKQDMGFLHQFVVTANTNSGATTGPATVLISPSIVATGKNQNVTNAIADNSAIVTEANHTANLAFHRNAFALVMVDLEVPDSAAWKATESHNGFNIRVIKAYDMVNDIESIRMDILFGVKTIYPDLACRMLG